MKQVGLPNTAVQIELGDVDNFFTDNFDTIMAHDKLCMEVICVSNTQVALFSCYLQVRNSYNIHSRASENKTEIQDTIYKTIQAFMS